MYEVDHTYFPPATEYRYSNSSFRSYVIRYPEDHMTVLVLTNRRGPDVKPLAERVAAIYLP